MRTDLTPIEKMDIVYDIVVTAEERRIREFRYRVIKWIIILVMVFGVVTYPEYIVGKFVSIIQPIIMEQMKDVIEAQKESLLQQAKDMLPDSY